MGKQLMEYVTARKHKSGTRYYFRRRGSKTVRLPDDINSSEFRDQYELGLKGKLRKSGAAKKVAEAYRPVGKIGTIDRLIKDYRERSDEWADSSQRLRYKRGFVFDKISKELGTINVVNIRRRHIEKWLEKYRDVPGTANEHLKAWRALFRYAVKIDLIDYNIARDVEYRRRRNPVGFHCWTQQECEQFEAYHPIGSMPRLAFALAIYTGQRRSDVVRLGPPMIYTRTGSNIPILGFTQEKNRARKPVRVNIPMHTELLKIIEASETGDETYLVGWKGDPYSAKSFGNRFKKWCKEAGLPDNCAIHGLRKACAGRLAEIGCTTHQIMAITGHKTMKEVERYTEQYRQLEAAFEAFEMWEKAA